MEASKRARSFSMSQQMRFMVHFRMMARVTSMRQLHTATQPIIQRVKRLRICWVKAYIDTYHFPANVTNTSNNYGPYQFPEKLIPLIINNALHGKKLPVYGDGLNIRDWLYVDDHAKGIDMVQEQGRLGESYNIGGHNEKRNIEIINIIIETLAGNPS